MKNIVRPALVTLPRFVQDQDKYKATLRQIGRLNGILPRAHHAAVAPKKHGANTVPGATAHSKRRTAGRRRTTSSYYTRTKSTQQRGVSLTVPTPVPPSPPTGSTREPDLHDLDDARPTEEAAVPTDLITPLVVGYLDTTGKRTGGSSVAIDGGAGILDKTNTARWRAAETKDGHEESSYHDDHGRSTLQVAPTLRVDGKLALRSAVAPSRPHTSPIAVADRACHGGITSARDTGDRYRSFTCDLTRPSGRGAETTAVRRHSSVGGLAAESHGWPLCSPGGDHHFELIHTLEGEELLLAPVSGLSRGTLPRLANRTC